MKFTIFQLSVIFSTSGANILLRTLSEMPQIYVLSSRIETVTSDEWLKLFLPPQLTNLHDLFYDTLSAASQNVERYDDYKIWHEIY
jgi:hypothetical protein